MTRACIGRRVIGLLAVVVACAGCVILPGPRNAGVTLE